MEGFLSVWVAVLFSCHNVQKAALLIGNVSSIPLTRFLS